MKVNTCVFLLISASICSCSSQAKRDAVIDNLVIINASMSSRVSLAKDIAYINSLQPKVIAIDFQFSEQKSFYGDSMLIASLNQCQNLIMAVVIEDYSEELKDYDELTGTLPQFLTNARLGFVNLLEEKDEFHTLKRFSTYEEVNGKKSTLLVFKQR